ncbi:hypothetical protein CDL12_26226 [Handroanthus impetiginosus]|uniref:Uncharacterized protein n=1 Tax=Handroanthus impetiginosus TaxID=429701 RepID=A0A2G9G7V5_9LAMI|nr:hypothetical protein CDL12_26226 [Handroanthus impetiginosus]
MLCPGSTGKSGPSWLDRLRTARGFPDDGITDLEKFLQNPSSPSLERSDPKPNSERICDPAHNEDKQLFNIMSDYLNELFNFGDKCSNPTQFKKSARKQTNPRICTFSNNGSHEGKNVAVELLRSGDSNSGVEGVKELCKWENEGEEAERDVNLTGFSRTEVTVIDTSYEMWKFEKLLYRKKNVWKVRDKKGKSEISGRKKKRKVSGGMEEDQHEGKKLKVDKNEGRGVESQLPLNEVYHHISNSEVHEKAPNKEKKQADLKSDNGSSSVILIKSIHTGKKNGTSISKNCLKLKQKKT